MITTNFVNITDKLIGYRGQIDFFLKQLGVEKEFFNLTTEMVLKSKLVLVARDNDDLIGIAGIERKYGIARTYLMVKKYYHGKGFGTRFKSKLLTEAKKKNHIIMAVIDEKNVKSLKHNLATGARVVGKRGNLSYLFWVTSTRGSLFNY